MPRTIPSTCPAGRMRSGVRRPTTAWTSWSAGRMSWCRGEVVECGADVGVVVGATVEFWVEVVVLSGPLVGDVVPLDPPPPGVVARGRPVPIARDDSPLPGADVHPIGWAGSACSMTFHRASMSVNTARARYWAPSSVKWVPSEMRAVISLAVLVEDLARERAVLGREQLVRVEILDVGARLAASSRMTGPIASAPRFMFSSPSVGGPSQNTVRWCGPTRRSIMRATFRRYDASQSGTPSLFGRRR